MHTSRVVGAVLLLAALGAGAGRDACAAGATAAVTADAARAPASQSFALRVDGKAYTMDVAHPRQAHFVRANVTANRVFSFSASDRQGNFLLVVSAGAEPGRALAPGVYESYNCDPDHAFDEPPRPLAERLTAAIMPHADVPNQVGDLKEAVKAPKLGLSPLLVTITRVEDANIKGVGRCKRVVGSFSGRLAHVRNDKSPAPQVVGRIAEVEGTFDLYAVMYDD